MEEYRLAHFATVPRGRVVFRFHNAGTLDHGPVLIPLPADAPPIAVQLRGSERRSVSPLAGIAPSPPGSRRSLAVDLRPGRYALICTIADPDGRTHAVKGMASDLRVR